MDILTESDMDGVKSSMLGMNNEERNSDLRDKVNPQRTNYSTFDLTVLRIKIQICASQSLAAVSPVSPHFGL